MKVPVRKDMVMATKGKFAMLITEVTMMVQEPFTGMTEGIIQDIMPIADIMRQDHITHVTEGIITHRLHVLVL